jgi:tetratricopeptide (TPR) repeat protein
MAELEHGAEQDKCIDEVLLMRAIIARSLLGAGQTRDSLVAAARGLRLAHTAGLHYRANFMYRMASTAYEELGDVARTRRCQERAIQLADALGLRDMAGIGWSRLATSERKAGRYGNALQYFDRAIAVLVESGPAWSRTQAHVGLYGLLVLTQHDRRSAKAAELVNRLKGSREHNTLGFYYYWRGLDLEFRGNTAAALRSYHKSNQHFASVGQRSNIAWALSRQVRVHLHKREFKVTSDLLLQLESMSSGSREAEFELSIVKLKASYLAREPSRIVLEFAKECEEGLRRDQNAYLRIEALQAVFRVYARRSMAEQARSSLDRYREALLEISSNVDRSQAARIAEISGAVEMAGELSALDRITRSGRGPAIAGP